MERSVSAQRASCLNEKPAGMLWFGPWGGQQNHLIDGSEPRAVYLHVCFAEQIHTERECPHWWSSLSLTFCCKWVSLLVQLDTSKK